MEKKDVFAKSHQDPKKNQKSSSPFLNKAMATAIHHHPPTTTTTTTTTTSHQTAGDQSTDGTRIIAKRFRSEKVIARGAFGVVHSGRTINSWPPERVAVKIACAEHTKSLDHEYSMFQRVQRHYDAQNAQDDRDRDTGDLAAAAAADPDAMVCEHPPPKTPLPIPRALWCGSSDVECVMVTELVNGVDLRRIFKSMSSVIGDAMLASWGMCMLSRVRELHAAGVIHGDIKAENFVYCNTLQRLFLVDLGLASRCRARQTSVPCFSGTLAFASISAHLHRSLSRRDDLVSLAYVLLFLWRGGDLPWFEKNVSLKQMTPEQRDNYIASVGRHKQRAQACNLFTHPTDPDRPMPQGLHLFYTYAHSLKVNQMPDYALLETHLQLIYTQDLATTNNQ